MSALDDLHAAIWEAVIIGQSQGVLTAPTRRKVDDAVARIIAAERERIVNALRLDIPAGLTPRTRSYREGWNDALAAIEAVP